MGEGPGIVKKPPASVNAALDAGAKTPSLTRAPRHFLAALERVPAEREAFLAEACGMDTVLRREVVSLLACHQETVAIGQEPPVTDEVFGNSKYRRHYKRVSVERLMNFFDGAGLGCRNRGSAKALDYDKHWRVFDARQSGYLVDGCRRPPTGSPLGTRSGTVRSKSGSSSARRNAMRSPWPRPRMFSWRASGSI